LKALQDGLAGLVAIFSSVSPIVILPLLWLIYRKRPALGAWVGASLAITGTALILGH
jgi:drug/metabolite transporter (DMT)-like permease